MIKFVPGLWIEFGMDILPLPECSSVTIDYRTTPLQRKSADFLWKSDTRDRGGGTGLIVFLHVASWAEKNTFGDCFF